MADRVNIEYKVVSGKSDVVEKQLNELAAHGWIVEHVTNAAGGMGNFVLFGLSIIVTVVLRRG